MFSLGFLPGVQNTKNGKILLAVAIFLAILLSGHLAQAAPSVLLQVDVNGFIDSEGRSMIIWNRLYENATGEPVQINDNFAMGMDALTVARYWVTYNPSDLVFQINAKNEATISGEIPPGKTQIVLHSEFNGPWNNVSFGWLQQHHRVMLNLFAPRSVPPLYMTDLWVNLMLSREATGPKAYVWLASGSDQKNIDPTEVNRETSTMRWRIQTGQDTQHAVLFLDFSVPNRNRQITLGAWVIGILAISNIALWFTFRRSRGLSQ